jgi:ABC-2 type transport system permease protein
VVQDARTPASEGFVAGIRHSSWFTPVPSPDIHSAVSALKRQDVEGILWLRENFGRSLNSFRTHAVHVVVNGVDDNTARLVEGYMTNTWETWIGLRNLRGRQISF